MGFFERLFGWTRKRDAAPELSYGDIGRIKMSFSKVVPISGLAAEIFYTRLFDIAPEVRPLFPGDVGSEAMAEQGKKLIATLAVVVNSIENLDAVAPTAAALAVRHVDYGVKPEHYAPVGQALLITLKEGLGDEFTPEVEASWAKAYTILSGAMISAAYPGVRGEAVA